MTDYNAMSLDELYMQFSVDMTGAAWNRLDELVERRRAARDAILDMAEGLDAEGLVVVPREPTPRMLHAADGYTDLIQPFDVEEGAEASKEAKKWRHNEFKCAWWAMLAAAPPAPEVG